MSRENGGSQGMMHCRWRKLRAAECFAVPFSPLMARARRMARAPTKAASRFLSRAAGQSRQKDITAKSTHRAAAGWFGQRESIRLE
jgi:hypothetical protein